MLVTCALGSLSMGVVLSMLVSTEPPAIIPEHEYVPIANILRLSSVPITNDNWNCSGERHKTVGDLLGSMLNHHISYKDARLSYACYYTMDCAIELTDCASKEMSGVDCDWKSLSFDFNGNYAINEKSFVCSST